MDLGGGFLEPKLVGECIRLITGKDRVQLDLLEGAGHRDPQFEAPDNVNKVLDFLDKHIKENKEAEEALRASWS
jgi:hypothetical protein